MLRLRHRDSPDRGQAAIAALERFQAKWLPVRVKKTRQNKKIEPRSDSIGTEKALAPPGFLQATVSNGDRASQCGKLMMEDRPEYLRSFYASLVCAAAPGFGIPGLNQPERVRSLR